jgi:hypothetical protein
MPVAPEKKTTTALMGPDGFSTAIVPIASSATFGTETVNKLQVKPVGHPGVVTAPRVNVPSGRTFDVTLALPSFAVNA